MVEPPRIGRAALLLIGAAGALAQAGCSFVPSARLEDCRSLSRTLQAENSRLKDVALKNGAQNRDLTQRAVDDADTIRRQGDAIARLERSVQAYQDEREQMAAAFERIRRQVDVSPASASAAASEPVPASAASSGPAALPLSERVLAFAREHPGCEYDAGSETLSLPVDRLFEPKSTRLTPEGLDMLIECAGLLSGDDARSMGLVVVGPAEGGPVRRAGIDGDLEAPRARFMSRARAARVREALAQEGGLDASRITLEAAGPEDPTGAGGEPPPRRISLRMRPEGGGAQAGDRP